MANRNFNRAQALDKEVKFLYLYADVTADDGSVTLNKSKSVGIKSIEGGTGSTHGAGKYHIVLGTPGGDTDKYSALLHVSAILEDDTHHGANGGVGFQLYSDSTSSTASANLLINDGIIKFMTLQENGQAADPKENDAIRIQIVVKNSNQPGVGV